MFYTLLTHPSEHGSPWMLLIDTENPDIHTRVYDFESADDALRYIARDRGIAYPTYRIQVQAIFGHQDRRDAPLRN